MFDMKKFADFIAEKRKKQGLTQEQLSDLIGVSHQAVSKWERCEAMPEISKLGALAKALGVQTDDVIASMYNDIGRDEAKEEVLPVKQKNADAEYYALPDKLSVGDVYYLAPNMSPAVLREAIEAIINIKGTRSASMLFQFADDDFLKELAAPLLSKGDTTLVAYVDEKLIKREVINLITTADLSPDRGTLLALYQKAGEILIHSKDEHFIDETFAHTVAATGNWNVWKHIISKFPQEVLVNQGTKYMIWQGTSSFNAWWGLLGRRVIARMFLGYADHFNNNEQAWRDIALYYDQADRQIMESSIKTRIETCRPAVFAPLFDKLSDELKKLLEEKGVKGQKQYNNNYNNGNNNYRGRIPNMQFFEQMMQGNFDDRFDDFDERIDDLDSRLDDLEGRLDDFDEIREKIEEIKEYLEELKESIG